MGGATSENFFEHRRQEYFNPRSPWGERPGRCETCRQGCCHFNPRSPWGERLSTVPLLDLIVLFQSTLPVGGATPTVPFAAQYIPISIHAPRGGSDTPSHSCAPMLLVFQSTLPVGGATLAYFFVAFALFYFNPRSPWGERLLGGRTARRTMAFQSTLPVGGATSVTALAVNALKISIHAPRGGSDLSIGFIGLALGISIHAPRGGSDCNRATEILPPMDFNPRSPWGERRQGLQTVGAQLTFQSTLPVGGATR